MNYSENKTLKESYPNEVFNIANKEIYLWCEEGYINTKLNNSNVEKRLKTTATTRNWKTITEINSLFDSYL